MTTHTFAVEIMPEPAGGYSARALTIPGAVSQGETMAEVTANIREAIEAVVASHIEAGEEIPWIDADPTPVPIRVHLAIEVE